MSSSSMSNFGAQMRPTMQAGNFMGSPMGPVWGSGFQPVVEPVFNLGFESDPEFCQLVKILLNNCLQWGGSH